MKEDKKPDSFEIVWCWDWIYIFRAVVVVYNPCGGHCWFHPSHA